MPDLPVLCAALALAWGVTRIFCSPLRAIISLLVHLEAGLWALRLGLSSGIALARARYPECLEQPQREAAEWQSE